MEVPIKTPAAFKQPWRSLAMQPTQAVSCMATRHQGLGVRERAAAGAYTGAMISAGSAGAVAEPLVVVPAGTCSTALVQTWPTQRRPRHVLHSSMGAGSPGVTLWHASPLYLPPEVRRIQAG